MGEKATREHPCGQRQGMFLPAVTGWGAIPDEKFPVDIPSTTLPRHCLKRGRGQEVEKRGKRLIGK